MGKFLSIRTSLPLISDFLGIRLLLLLFLLAHFSALSSKLQIERRRLFRHSDDVSIPSHPAPVPSLRESRVS